MNRTDTDNARDSQGPESTPSSDFEKRIFLERKLSEATALAAGIGLLLKDVGTNLAAAKAGFDFDPTLKAEVAKAKEAESGGTARKDIKTRLEKAIAKERSKESSGQVDENSVSCDQPPAVPKGALPAGKKSPKPSPKL